LRLDELRIGESEQLGNGTASVDSQSGQYRLAHQGGLDDIGNRALAGQNSRSTRRLSSGIGSSLIASVRQRGLIEIRGSNRRLAALNGETIAISARDRGVSLRRRATGQAGCAGVFSLKSGRERG